MAEDAATQGYSTSYMPANRRQKYLLLRSQLDYERSTFISAWSELAKFIFPRRPRFLISDVNRGDKRHQSIIDNTGTLAARTLRSGMMGGVTSPARPWFRIATHDPDDEEKSGVKEWLFDVTEKMRNVFLKSNLYNALPIVYGDIGTFGTACMMVEEDFDDVIRCYPFPIGSYYLAQNERLQVDVFLREFRMTVRQLVDKFAKRKPMPAGGKLGDDIDWSNFSVSVQNFYRNSHFEVWVDVIHVIDPNEDFDPEKIEGKFKKYRSCYFERGSAGSVANIGSGQDVENKFLRESGFDEFPILAPRWEVTGEDVYGTTSPGQQAIGDIKQLQLGEKRIMQAIDKLVNPPLKGPPELKGKKVSVLPGDFTGVTERDGGKGLTPIYQVEPKIQEMEAKQAQVRERIRKAFYEDLFLMMIDAERNDITATEVQERKEEKLLALGPVLEQLNQDLLDPLIDITFAIMLRQGLIPPPPEELAGQDLKVEYLSIMAQAQKLVGVESVERFAQFLGGIVKATGDTSALDKVDLDKMVETYGDMTSIPPGIIRPDDETAKIRQGRAQQQQEKDQQEQALQTTQAAKNLAQAPLDTPNALKSIMDQAHAGDLAPAA